MRTLVLGPDVIRLELTKAEHRDQVEAVRRTMSSIAAIDIPDDLGLDAQHAYEFCFGMLVLEAAGRISGVKWLGRREAGDARLLHGHPAFSITYAADGATWRLTAQQLAFVRACTARDLAEHPRRSTSRWWQRQLIAA